MQDEDLIALLKANSDEAIFELNRRYRKTGEGLARRICGKEYADEVFSDALMVVLHGQEFDCVPALSAFLFRAVRNLALKKREFNSAKKRMCESITLSFDESLFPSGENVVADDPESLFSAKETAQYINGYLERLSPDARKIFVCRCYFGMSVKETARHLKISESKIKTSLHRTRNELKELLERNGLI